MGTATVVNMTPEEIRAECQELLAVLRVGLDEAPALAEAGVLTPEQYAALRRIQDLNWLLEDE